MRLAAFFAGFCTLPISAAPCESLRALSLPDTTIRVSESVTPGALALPTNKPLPVFQKLPAFCRVAAELRPTADSLIRMEVWLPAPAAWNRRFQGEGNGGFAGSVNYNDLAGALIQNYAAASTDTGHQADTIDAAWALRHPEKITDFGYRAIHLMTARAKAITAAYYGDAPDRSYFVGCSNGGRQALMEAQRFPDDYDGILAGAPANNWAHMVTSGADIAGTVMKSDASYIPPTKISAIAAAVLKQCDGLDGLKDGILNDPTQCRFDPAALLCEGVDTAQCLTAPQITSLRKIYEGGRDSKGGQIFPGALPGGEEGPGGWKAWITGDKRGEGSGAGFANGYFRYMVFDDPAWTANTKPIDTSLNTAVERTSRQLDATDADLTAFQKHGGKLILYHGWNDPAISPLNTVSYYNAVTGKSESVRLYMVPGMQHCYGGPGPSAFGQVAALSTPDPTRSVITALEQWVEKGTAPAAIRAMKFKEDNPAKGPQMARPLCPYPQNAKYDGTGDPNTAQSFACR